MRSLRAASVAILDARMHALPCGCAVYCEIKEIFSLMYTRFESLPLCLGVDFTGNRSIILLLYVPISVPIE
uniref:Putative secreted protein n=1 Tax=Anopheles marajoara TaxID=58244 RepID=A0A2M4CE93_9DIPT